MFGCSSVASIDCQGRRHSVSFDAASNNVFFRFLKPFARVTKNNEPFLGLMITTFIAELAILLGAVDAIAEVSSA